MNRRKRNSPWPLKSIKKEEKTISLPNKEYKRDSFVEKISEMNLSLPESTVTAIEMARSNQEKLKAFALPTSLTTAKHQIESFQVLMAPDIRNAKSSSILTTAAQIMKSNEHLQPLITATRTLRDYQLKEFLSPTIAQLVEKNNERFKNINDRLGSLISVVNNPFKTIDASDTLIAKVGDLIKYQEHFGNISWANVSKNLIGNRIEKSNLFQSLTILANTYNTLSTQWYHTNNIKTLYPELYSIPSDELYNTSRILEEFSEEPGGTEATKEGTENHEEIVTLLSELHRDYLGMWNGAIMALQSANPDKARHFAASLRELVRHVLHHIAPEDEIRKWSNSPEHYDKGNPIRRARLLYLTRNVNHGSFSNFVNDDINATLSFIDLLHKPTHVSSNPYTDEQLNALRVKGESTIKYLIRLHKLR